jgi:hypothetical protein
MVPGSHRLQIFSAVMTAKSQRNAMINLTIYEISSLSVYLFDLSPGTTTTALLKLHGTSFGAFGSLLAWVLGVLGARFRAILLRVLGAIRGHPCGFLGAHFVWHFGVSRDTVRVLPRTYFRRVGSVARDALREYVLAVLYVPFTLFFWFPSCSASCALAFYILRITYDAFHA